MKEIKLFLATSNELEHDRMRIGDLIRRLNDSYEKRFIHLRLIEWEDVDSFYNHISKQRRYDDLIIQCDLFIGLFRQSAGRHLVHESVVARAHLRPEDILIFRKTDPAREDHAALKEKFAMAGFRVVSEAAVERCDEGSESVKRFPEEDDLNDWDEDPEEFLKERDSFVSYSDFSELSRVLSEKLEAYCASIEVTDEEKARTYSRNTVRIHVAASPEVEPDVALLGDLVRRLDENSKYYCRIRMIDELPGSDMFVALCHTGAPDDLRAEIESAIEENAKSAPPGKPRLYFCMKYVGKDEKKDPSMEVLENQFRTPLSRYPDRYTGAPEMKLHFMLQLERLQRETFFSDVTLVIEKGVIYQKVGETWNPVMSCEDMAPLQKDESYRKMKERLFMIDKELDGLKMLSREAEQDLTGRLRQRLLERRGIEEKMTEKQKGYLKLARTLEEKTGQEQDELIQCVRELFQAGKIDRVPELQPKPEDHRSEEKEADSYHAYGCSLRDCGLYDNALVFLEKALTIRQRVFGEDHPGVADSCHNIGSVWKAQGDYDKALEFFEKALAIRQRVFGEDHPGVADSCHNICSVWTAQGHYDKAVEYFEKALAIRLRVFGEDHPGVADSFNSIGYVWFRKGDVDKALENEEKALAIRLRVFGEDHPGVADCCNDIGNFWSHKGDDDKALEYHGKALAIRLRVLGEDHPHVAGSCHNIGIIWKVKGNCNKALEYHEKALAIRLRVFGEDHSGVADSYHNIGNAWSAKGNYDKALECHEKALAIRLHVLGNNHPRVADSYNNIGNAWSAKGNYDKSLECHEKALAIRLRVLGDNDLSVADSYNNIGNAWSAKGNYDKALEYHEKALAIRLRVLGDNDLSVADSYCNIGSVWGSKDDDDKALDCYEKALAIRLRVLGNKHPSVAESCQIIGGVWGNKNDHDRSLKYYEEALSIRRHVFGEKHLSVAETCNSIGNAWYDKDDYDKALENYEKALSIRLQVFGEEHPLVAQSYHNLGSAWKAKGDCDKAMENYEKALSIRLQVFGENHPDVAKSYNFLESIWRFKGDYDKAMEYYEKARAVYNRIAEENSLSDAKKENDLAVAEKCKQLGGSLYEKGVYRESYWNYIRAIDLYRSIYGEDDCDVANCYEGILKVCHKIGNSEMALEYYEKLMAIDLRSLREGHPVLGKIATVFVNKVIIAPIRRAQNKMKKKNKNKK